jgi:hypothetical protein
MPTLMTRTTFEELKKIREMLIAGNHNPLTAGQAGKIAGLFQRDMCAISLSEELEQLHHSLVVIASNETQNVLDHDRVFSQLIPNWKPNFEDNWRKHYHEQTGLYWFYDQRSGNLCAHGYHPRPTMQQGFWGAALGRTIQLARALMPRFACFG